ncbi:hypothetical protein QBC39DRAFT_35847 [Podospora conica]|nr:hypothetical protein QBC39DRAFT_35847 [Schizothecium conicum]
MEVPFRGFSDRFEAVKNDRGSSRRSPKQWGASNAFPSGLCIFIFVGCNSNLELHVHTSSHLISCIQEPILSPSRIAQDIWVNDPLVFSAYLTLCISHDDGLRAVVPIDLVTVSALGRPRCHVAGRHGRHRSCRDGFIYFWYLEDSDADSFKLKVGGVDGICLVFVFVQSTLLPPSPCPLTRLTTTFHPSMSSKKMTFYNWPPFISYFPPYIPNGPRSTCSSLPEPLAPGHFHLERKASVLVQMDWHLLT